MNNVICLIPSRLSSRRLPGKALLEIRGIPLIIHVAKRAMLSASIHETYVCTDSLEISQACSAYNIPFFVTKSHYRNGTERIASVAHKFPGSPIIDVQGDEPLLNPNHIDSVVQYLTTSPFSPDIVIPTLKTPYSSSDSIVRVLTSKSGRVMSLTRASVPYPFAKRPQFSLKHLSIIGFNPSALERYSALEPTYLEEFEDIELLRAIESDFNVYSTELTGDSFSVDLEDDYIKAKLAFESDPFLEKYLG